MMAWARARWKYVTDFVGEVRDYLKGAALPIWARIGPILLSEVPVTEAWGFLIQEAFVLSCYTCVELWPAFLGHSIPTGAAIAALGFGAVIMTARADKFAKTEQIVWVIIAFVLLFGELVVIERDRAAQDHEHIVDMRKQQEEFERTLQGLENTESVLTGGESYDVISTLPVSLSPHDAAFTLMISVRGRNPLWDVVIEMEKGPINARYYVSHIPDYLAGRLRTSIIHPEERLTSTIFGHGLGPL